MPLKHVPSNKETKKLEFSQKILTVFIIISVVFTGASYILSAFDKNPVEELSMTIVNVLWGCSGGAFISYTLQNSIRAIAANKWGIKKDEGDIFNGSGNQHNNNTD